MNEKYLGGIIVIAIGLIITFSISAISVVLREALKKRRFEEEESSVFLKYSTARLNLLLKIADLAMLIIGFGVLIYIVVLVG